LSQPSLEPTTKADQQYASEEVVSAPAVKQSTYLLDAGYIAVGAVPAVIMAYAFVVGKQIALDIACCFLSAAIITMGWTTVGSS
jgi:hypothetical protein